MSPAELMPRGRVSAAGESRTREVNGGVVAVIENESMGLAGHVNVPANNLTTGIDAHSAKERSRNKHRSKPGVPLQGERITYYVT